MLTIDQFIERYGLSMQAAKVPARMDGVEWTKGASHWYCTISRMTYDAKGNTRPPVCILYSMGSALKGAPKLRDVLDCIASDATGIEQPFEDWAGDLGYDPDSRKALDTYLTIQRQSRALRQLLDGHAAFLQLVEDVERL